VTFEILSVVGELNLGNRGVESTICPGKLGIDGQGCVLNDLRIFVKRNEPGTDHHIGDGLRQAASDRSDIHSDSSGEFRSGTKRHHERCRDVNM
jgi:hypothetical protein